MGQTLSEPVTIKESDEGYDKRVMYAGSKMQGWRISMEDAHVAIPSYADTSSSFFAVFDGHGGPSVAKYSAKHLPDRIFLSPSFKNQRYRDALRKGYLLLDEELRQNPSLLEDTSGATAVSALLTRDNVLYVSNVGDSRAIICTSNGKAIPLSKDHKPTDPLETKRIKEAGGYVEFKRVNGSLALSRALGDFTFKNNSNLPPERQAVTAYPDITEHELTDNDEFMVLACDGIWDCLSNQEVVDYIRYELKQKRTLKEICENIMDFCLAESGDMTGIGCDNMTIMVIAFLRKKTTQQWYEWMANKTNIKDPPVRRAPKLPVNVVVRPDSNNNINSNSNDNTDVKNKDTSDAENITAANTSSSITTTNPSTISL